MALFNGTTWTGISFSSSQYAQAFQQLIADLYASYQSGGYFLRGTTSSIVPAISSQSFTAAVDANYFGPGAFVVITSVANPTTNWWAGVVTAVSTSSITVNCLVATGAVGDSSWNISVIGTIRTTAPGSTRMGQTGQTTAAATLTALDIDNIGSRPEGIYDDFMGAVAPVISGIQKMDRWTVSLTNGGILRSNAAPLYAGDPALYNLIPGAAVSNQLDWAAHPGVIALETKAVSDIVDIGYGTLRGQYVLGSAGDFILDIHVNIPIAATASNNFRFFAGLTGTSFLSDYMCIGIGQGISVNSPPMRVIMQRAVSFGGLTTVDTGFNLLPGTWYTIRLQATRISIIGSNNTTVGSNSKPVILASTTFAGATTNAMYPRLRIERTAGSGNLAALVDYFAFKPGSLTR